MQKFHLLCNAHLDPIWLWPREEGAAEAISTFRVAAEFCEEYDGFVFNHNESVLYEWVEKNEPELFARIQSLVKKGKWHIIGGWYLQPDCLMPSAEGFLRQIETGNKYFIEKFGVKPTIAANFDPFGHTRGLVQLMKKSGYDGYIFMRPNGIVPEHNFIWEGYDGSKIKTHCIRGGYNSLKGIAPVRLREIIAEPHTNPELMLWGIGNHGGGPSKEDLDGIAQIMKEQKNVKIRHSFAEDYFSGVDWGNVETKSNSLQHIFVGCYTTMNRIKKAYRSLENELITAEKMAAAADMEFDFSEVEKAMLFSQFHDILPGTMIKKGEEQVLKLIGYGQETLSRVCNEAFFKLASGQKAAKRGEIPVLVFNPHPYPVTREIDIEFQLEGQNWTENETTLARVRDSKGNYLPAQNEQESSNLNLDWRKRVVFTATLEPMSINRFDCELYAEKTPRRPIAPQTETDTHFVFDNGKMRLTINKRTGLIDEYVVGGKPILNKGSAQINAFADFSDPWKMDNQVIDGKIGSFKVLSKTAANEFRGFREQTLDNVRIIENGAVRTKIEAIFRHKNSFAIVTYTVPKNDVYVDMQVKLLSNDVRTAYKLSFNTAIRNAKFSGQTAYGVEPLRTDGNEVCFQKWCALKNKNSAFSVLNEANYGGSLNGKKLNITLLRTCIYAQHPIPNREKVTPDRYHDHIDMGEHEFSFRLIGNGEFLDAQAECYNQPVYAYSFFPSGAGERKETKVTLDNQNILLSSYRKRETQKLLRLYNGSDKKQKTILYFEGKEFKLTFKPFEAKAVIIQNGKLTETTLSFIE